MKQQKSKLFLDTSVIVHRATRSKRFVESQVEEWNKSDIYTSYYVLYEFITGIIQTGIEYYLFVKLYDNVAEAKVAWSDNFKIRTLKNTDLVEAVMLTLDNSVLKNTKEDYLNGIEGTIIFLWTTLKTDFKGFVGQFGNHEIFDVDLSSSEDFLKLSAVLKRSKFIDLSDFWENHKEELKIINEHFEKIPRGLGSLKGFFENLKKIEADKKEAGKQTVARFSGDALIAVEASKNMKILAFDNSFGHLCPALKKEFQILQKKPLQS